MAKLIQVFPLSIYRDQLGMSLAERSRAGSFDLRDGTGEPPGQQAAHSAWLGDTEGHEFLFQLPPFAELYRRIAAQVRTYTEELGLNHDNIAFYFQRSWATITRRGEKISEHSHEQSNISVAYYLLKPEGSGGIHFRTEHHPNEFSRGIFTPSKAELGFIRRPGVATGTPFASSRRRTTS